MPCSTDPECARSAPEQLQQAPATLLLDGPGPRSESTQASGATVDETRAPAELMPDLRHSQQPTSPATKANKPAESQLNATELKTKVAEASDESSSSMSSSPADPALKKTKKKDPVSANTEPKNGKLNKTLLQRATKRPLQHSSPEKPAVKLVKPDLQATSSQRLQSPQPTKQNGSTYLPGVAGEVQTASWPDNRDWHASSPEKPWWNTAAEGTARVPGVTCWNSKYSVWVIDLTQEYLSDSGLTSKITRSYGVKDECGASEQKVRTAWTTKAARALRMTAPRRC
ncbi:hypothetical protein PF003_g12729 [Phytophthora fragariae]|nr:hypothetical protein PF003_g12729 [Phytophthora fragariae]